jgi:hypothetical protein
MSRESGLMGRRSLFLRGGRRDLALAVARLEAADFERWLAERQRIRNRRFGLFVALSLSLHALFFSIKRTQDLEPPAPASSTPMNVRLLPGPQILAEAPSTPPPPAPPRPRPPVVTASKSPPVVRADASKTTTPIEEPQPAPVPPAPEPAPPMDMAAMVEQRREARRRAQEGAGRSPPDPRAKEDPALASINRNLASLANRGEGIGGVFQVLRKGVRTGEFAFNGWKPDRNRTWREVIEVDAGPGGDVELAMVRRMIDLIRTHYTGDFQWESHRLGRVITLSARPADQPGLEDFMVKEFFGTPGLARSR